MKKEITNHSNKWLVFILTVGVFGILNTEMGVVGILPLIAETFHVTVPEAGWTVSIFALGRGYIRPDPPARVLGIQPQENHVTGSWGFSR